MTMRTLLNIVPFMRESGKAAMVVKRELMMGTPREGNPEYVPGTTPRAAAQTGHGRALYGLPCARCGTYYAAELPICPVCNSTERVLPRLEPTAWPAPVPQSKAVALMQEKNRGGLATINRELFAKPRIVQAMQMLGTTEAIPVPA